MIQQIITVKSKERNSFKGVIDCYEKIDDKCIKLFTFDCVLGEGGIVHYEQKKEGDLCTPSGVYELGFVFGYEKRLDTKMDYIEINEEDKWIDDPEHHHYNLFVRGKTDAKSYENMKRGDNLYKLGIVINYNINPVIKYKGSAIFIHIWENENKPTKGCIATSEENLRSLIKWLDPEKNPIIKILI